jgi:dephospho-CoA kinase
MTGRGKGRLKKIAVTGGIGSGKSKLVSELAAFGYPVFDADILVSQVVLDESVKSQIIGLLGPDAYAADEATRPVYQRAWVRDRVFSDVPTRKALEAIIHPAIFRQFNLICDQLNKLSDGIWVFYEAALIFESGRKKEFDAVVSVIAPEDVRRIRLSQSRNLSQDAMTAIFSAQVSDDVRRSESHFVVENSVESESLTSHALSLIENLRHFFHPRSR